MPEFHAEPYVCVAGLSHKSALIAWGAFYFRVRPSGAMKMVDDDDLWFRRGAHRQLVAALPFPPRHG
jgi:hypothetical protein